MIMDFIARKFRTLVFLVLVVGVVVGVVMSQRGMEITLGPVHGTSITLGKPATRPAAVAAPSAAAGAASQRGVGTTASAGQPASTSAGALGAGRPISGTVQQV